MFVALVARNLGVPEVVVEAEDLDEGRKVEKEVSTRLAEA